MSLNWNVSEVKHNAAWRKCTETWPDRMECSDEQRAAGTEFMHPGTNSLIWTCMSVGLNSITEKNFREFSARAKMYEGVLGQTSIHSAESAAHWTKMDQHMGWTWREGDSWIDLDFIYAHVGLHTNATRETRSQFVSKIMRIFEASTDGFEERREAKA